MSKIKKGRRRGHGHGGAPQRGTGPAPRRVLQDHVQQGKRFVPPMLRFFDGINRGAPEIDWIRWALPELLWIGLLENRFGPHQAAATAEAVISAAAKTVAVTATRTLAATSPSSDEGGAPRGGEGGGAARTATDGVAAEAAKAARAAGRSGRRGRR